MWLLQTTLSRHSFTNTVNWCCLQRVPLHPYCSLCIAATSICAAAPCTHPHHLSTCAGRGVKEGGTCPSASIAGLKHLSSHQHWANSWENRGRVFFKTWWIKFHSTAPPLQRPMRFHNGVNDSLSVTPRSSLNHQGDQRVEQQIAPLHKSVCSWWILSLLLLRGWRSWRNQGRKGSTAVWAQ